MFSYFRRTWPHLWLGIHVDSAKSDQKAVGYKSVENKYWIQIKSPCYKTDHVSTFPTTMSLPTEFPKIGRLSVGRKGFFGTMGSLCYKTDQHRTFLTIGFITDRFHNLAVGNYSHKIMQAYVVTSYIEFKLSSFPQRLVYSEYAVMQQCMAIIHC